jgi:sugar O-acyltransferase (sialic acid O-acetyltransferase NeuD family)
MQKVVIVGAGGFAREVLDILMAVNAQHPRYEILGFVDDNTELWGLELNGVRVLGGLEWLASARAAGVLATVAVGSPQTRSMLVQKIAAAGLGFCQLTHPSAILTPFIELGEGAIVTAGCILTNRITIGRHVHINLDCTLGHDAVLEDYATLAPGVHVSGWVHIGKRAYVGTGAVLINGTEEAPLTVGDDAVVGAGACVVRPVPAGVTVVGVPARPLGKA